MVRSFNILPPQISVNIWSPITTVSDFFVSKILRPLLKAMLKGLKYFEW